MGNSASHSSSSNLRTFHPSNSTPTTTNINYNNNNQSTPSYFNNKHHFDFNSINHSDKSKFNKINQTKIYNEILKDAKKLSQQDKKNNYNAHRRKDSIFNNLPSHLQSYSNAIYIINEFWLDYISPLNNNELNEIGMVLYCHLYLNCKNHRNILNKYFNNNNNNKINLPANNFIKIFTICGYIIRNLINPKNHIKLFKQLQVLGAMHGSHTIDNNIYEQILKAFNYAMEERYTSSFKIRTRFCFTQLYRVIVDIMTGNDFNTYTMTRISISISQSNNNNGIQSPLSPLLRRISTFRLTPHNSNNNMNHVPVLAPIHGVDTSSSSIDMDDDKNDIILDDDELERLQSQSSQQSPSGDLTPTPRLSTQRQIALYKQIDGFLGSLEDCLDDETGSLYFKKYLQEQFCVENFLFHEAVLKYKSAKNTHRKKLGEEIILKYVEHGSEKEVNLSYNTRETILSIVNLTKKMNENKEKYETLIKSANKNNVSIMTVNDMKMFNDNKNNNNNNKNKSKHLRVDTTKRIPLELAAITNDLNENIQDIVFSMGFTESLFDSAYKEIFKLMRINSWQPFRNAILEYCGDKDFIKQQKEKQQLKKKEQKLQLHMVQAVNKITRSHRKYTLSEQQKSQMKTNGNLNGLLNNNNNNSDFTQRRRRKLSQDDLDIIINNNINADFRNNNQMVIDSNYYRKKWLESLKKEKKFKNKTKPLPNLIHYNKKNQNNNNKSHGDILNAINQGVQHQKNKIKINLLQTNQFKIIPKNQLKSRSKSSMQSSMQSLAKIKSRSFTKSYSNENDASSSGSSSPTDDSDYEEFLLTHDSNGTGSDDDSDYNSDGSIIIKHNHTGSVVSNSNHAYNGSFSVSKPNPTSDLNPSVPNLKLKIIPSSDEVDIVDINNIGNDNDDNDNDIDNDIDDCLSKYTNQIYNIRNCPLNELTEISVHKLPKRLSFAPPKLIVGMQQSVTSPTVQISSNSSSLKLTPSGMGAKLDDKNNINDINHISACIADVKYNKKKHNNMNTGSYSPTQLFGMIESHIEKKIRKTKLNVKKNLNKRHSYMGTYGNRNWNKNKHSSIKSINSKKMVEKPFDLTLTYTNKNKNKHKHLATCTSLDTKRHSSFNPNIKPLYITHPKKRKSKQIQKKNLLKAMNNPKLADNKSC